MSDWGAASEKYVRFGNTEVKKIISIGRPINVFQWTCNDKREISLMWQQLILYAKKTHLFHILYSETPKMNAILSRDFESKIGLTPLTLV